MVSRLTQKSVRQQWQVKTPSTKLVFYTCKLKIYLLSTKFPKPNKDNWLKLSSYKNKIVPSHIVNGFVPMTFFLYTHPCVRTSWETHMKKYKYRLIKILHKPSQSHDNNVFELRAEWKAVPDHIWRLFVMISSKILSKLFFSVT